MRRWLALTVVLGIVLASAVVATITPQTARVNREAQFRYSGSETIVMWCARQPESTLGTWDFCVDTASTTFSYTFTRVGIGAVKVVFYADRGEPSEEVAVTVSP